MRKLNNTETKLKKALLMKKACSMSFIFTGWYACNNSNVN